MDPALPASLDALRDIHLPEAISFWPLAPGWWVLAAIAVGLAVGLAGWLRHRRRASWQEAAAAELDAIEASFAAGGNPTELAAALSALLRRAALARFRGESVAPLHGEAWVALLCHGDQVSDAHAPEVVRELARAAYGRSWRGVQDQANAWIGFVRTWIAEAA